MGSKTLVMAALMASMAAMPGTRAAADFADGLVGGIVGGAVSGVIVNEGAKARERRQHTTTRTRTRTYRAPAESAERQQVRETQVSLNYFGFPAGSPDGIRGRNTRNAVSQYQSYMGYPVTGYLAGHERQFLISSYHRAQSGGAATSQLIAQTGQGTRGLLHVWRDEATGVPTYANAPQTGQGQGTAPQTTASLPAFASEQAPAGSDPEGMAALPNLMGEGDGGRSLASHCNQVSLVTNSNGGFVTEASMTDPRFALNEQFCLARTYAIADGEKLAGKLQNVSSSGLEEQCRAFGPAMKEHLSALSVRPRDRVIEGVGDFVTQSGMSAAQLTGTARICLSVGYRTDNMDVALGSALLLTALGEGAYGELLGHHLTEGFGTARRPDLALAWYEGAIESVDRGARAVFSPGDSGRGALIRKAAYRLNNVSSADGAAGTVTQQDSTKASALPQFTLE